MNNPSPTARLRVRGLGHEFVRTRVLDDIHFELAAGELCALVGPSGCGKTTLLHLCNGLLDVQDGVIDNDCTGRCWSCKSLDSLRLVEERLTSGHLSCCRD